jgi:hypothetical protein
VGSISTGAEMRTREVPESNYGSCFTGKSTIRRRLDRSKPPLPLRHPEVEDVGLNTVCHCRCPYCYVDAGPLGVNFPEICRKADEVWGALPEEDRPYQIAIGGSGEPTLHPGLEEFCRKARSLGIVPNYTTNGMHVTEDLAQWTKELCGGVAVSYHSHRAPESLLACMALLKAGVPTSLHVILGPQDSAKAAAVVTDLMPALERVVILPYQAIGRAPVLPDMEREWELFLGMWRPEWKSRVAFGAGFYEFFTREREAGPVTEAIKAMDIDLYPPELFSGYRIMDDSYRMLRRSSYNPEERT